MDFKEQFIELYKKHITRPGSEKLLDYLCSESSDFFIAPASTRFHGCYAGGLVEHSLHVYECLVDYLSRERVKEEYNLEYSDETIAIVSLLHDICKVNVYKTYLKNVKEDGSWKQVTAYTFDDKLPYGHGEKSVYIVSGFMRLSREEAFAIRYHMGFSGEENKNIVGDALEKFPLALALNIADMEATFLMEGEEV